MLLRFVRATVTHPWYSGVTMLERPYNNFTAHKVPFHLDYPPLQTPLIEIGIDYLERIGGGTLHTKVQIDEETEISVWLELNQIRDKSEDEICAMFDAEVDRRLAHLQGLPPAYHLGDTSK